MTLYEQILVIIYHSIVGQLLGLIYSLLSLLFINTSSLFRTLLFSIVSIICTSLYYYGLYFINGGILHLYLFIILFISFYIYYSYFYVILIPAFCIIKGFLKPLKRKIDFEKKKIYGIMNRLRRNVKKNGQKSKQKKGKQTSISS